MQETIEHNRIPLSRRGEQLALFLTFAVNPLILPPLVMYLILSGLAEPWSATGPALLATTICFAVIPFITMAFIAVRNREITIELRTREYRTIPFIVSILANMGAIVFFAAWESSSRGLVMALMVAYLINNIALMIVNFRFKISLHMASVAGTASILFFMVSGARPISFLDERWILAAAGVCALLVPVIWWARQRLDAHTRKELTWGTLFGLILPFLELYILSPVFA